MVRTSHNKLVRDKIPQILEGKGIKANYDTLTDEQYEKCLEGKLHEEVLEYLVSRSVEELADVAEVVYALLDFKGVSLEDFNKIVEEKRAVRGGFKDRIYLRDTLE